jgi:hypothetical protein
MSCTQLHFETYFISLCSNQNDKFPEVYFLIGQICDRIPPVFLADQAVIDYGTYSKVATLHSSWHCLTYLVLWIDYIHHCSVICYSVFSSWVPMTSIRMIAIQHVYMTVFKHEIRLQMSEGHWSVHLHNPFLPIHYLYCHYQGKSNVQSINNVNKVRQKSAETRIFWIKF